jgi:hypothetical protein
MRASSYSPEAARPTPAASAIHGAVFHALRLSSAASRAYDPVLHAVDAAGAVVEGRFPCFRDHAARGGGEAEQHRRERPLQRRPGRRSPASDCAGHGRRCRARSQARCGRHRGPGARRRPSGTRVASQIVCSVVAAARVPSRARSRGRVSGLRWCARAVGLGEASRAAGCERCGEGAAAAGPLRGLWGFACASPGVRAGQAGGLGGRDRVRAGGEGSRGRGADDRRRSGPAGGHGAGLAAAVRTTG